MGWAEALLDRELGGRMQARRGELMDALEGEGLVALGRGQPVGLVTWHVDRDGQAAEVRALAVAHDQRSRGHGRALLDAAVDALRARGLRRAWLVTTNDNLAALALYQKAGYRLVALRPGAVDETRQKLKSSIPEFGERGIPLRDELELELEL